MPTHFALRTQVSSLAVSIRLAIALWQSHIQSRLEPKNEYSVLYARTQERVDTLRKHGSITENRSSFGFSEEPVFRLSWPLNLNQPRNYDIPYRVVDSPAP